MRAGRFRKSLLAPALAAAALGGAAGSFLGDCGPFTDVAQDAFCPFVLEIFYLGITTGTTPTTYDPSANVTRLQMAAFLSRTVDQALKRGGRRAALNQFWTTQDVSALGLVTLGGQTGQRMNTSDGVDLWVANNDNGSVSRVRGSDGKLLETWTGASAAYGVLSAMGRIFASSSAGQTRLYRIDPTQPAGAVTTVATNIGSSSSGIAFDGARIWVASADNTVSIVTPSASLPWTVTTVTMGATLFGALWDGASIWVTAGNNLVKLDPAGAVLQTVTVGNGPRYPAFDGTNIWVPNLLTSVSVVRASSGAVLATLTGNGMVSGSVFQAAFDGERILVTSSSGGLSLWKAADLSEIGSLDVSAMVPIGVCADGVNFWIA